VPNPFRNDHTVIAEAFSASAGTEEVFARPVLSGRARQAIWLKRIHTYFAMEPVGIGASDELEMVTVYHAGKEVPGDPGGAEPSTITSTLFNKINLAVGLQWKNRKQIIDSFRHTWRANAQPNIPGMWVRDWSEKYDLLVPHIQVLVGLAPTDITVTFEWFARFEYEWVDINLADMAALQFNWGLDPVDFDQEFRL